MDDYWQKRHEEDRLRRERLQSPDGRYDEAEQVFKNTGTGFFIDVDGRPWQLSQEDVDNWRAAEEREGSLWKIPTYRFGYRDPRQLMGSFSDEARRRGGPDAAMSVWVAQRQEDGPR